MARAHNNRPASTSGSKPRGGSATTGYEAELWRMAAESVAASFGRLVRPLVRRASDAVRETRILSALRDTLLPKLISGEVRVNQVEMETA